MSEKPRHDTEGDTMTDQLPPPPGAPGPDLNVVVSLTQDPPPPPQKERRPLRTALKVGAVIVGIYLGASLISAILADPTGSGEDAPILTLEETVDQSPPETLPAHQPKLHAIAIRMDTAVGILGIAIENGGAPQQPQAQLAFDKWVEWSEAFRPVPDYYSVDWFNFGDLLVTLADQAEPWTPEQVSALRTWQQWTDSEVAYWEKLEAAND